MSAEETTPFFIESRADLTAESQKLAEDAGIDILEIHPLSAEHKEAAKHISEGAIFSGPEGLLAHARRCAASAMVSFELTKHEKVVFPLGQVIVPLLIDENKGAVVPLISGRLISRGAVTVETLYRHAVFSTEKYIQFRDMANVWKTSQEE